MTRSALLLALTLTAACHDSGSTGPADLGPWPQAYAVATTLMANTPQATTLLFTVPSLDASVTVDYGQAITIADTVSLFGEPGTGRFFATTAQTANVTRYDVDDHGVITPGPVLSFATLGVSATYSTRSIAFVSPTKAYLLDDSSLQAISFDPSAMTLGSPIDLRGLGMTGYRTNFAYNVPRRGAQLVIAAFHYDSGYAHVMGVTDLALLDTTTDTVKLVHDDRCGVFSTAAMLPSGDIYFGQDTYAVALHRLGGDSVAPAGCVLRMKAGQDVLDPSFVLHVAEVTGGQPGGAAIAGPGETLWVRAFDESAFTVGPTTGGVDIMAAPAWRWWKIDPAQPGTATVANLPPGAGEVKWFAVDGHSFTGDANADYSMTAIVDLATGAPVRGAVVRGHPSGLIKVR
jgi:hypothetical protein